MSVFCQLSSEQQAELWATLALRHSKGIGATRAKLLVDIFGTPFQAVNAFLHDSSAWAAHNDIIPDSVRRSFASETWREKAKLEWDAIKTHNCSFLLWTDPLFPARLKDLTDAPLILYYKGDVSLLSAPAVGVVGSRSCTNEGIGVAAFLSRGLSKAGVTIISGMAKGIDRVAHLAGLEGVGKSVAVLGTGIDCVYPQCNADLEKILARDGLIITEFMPGATASPAHFPVRNRIISGLSHGVLVIEAAGRSGSLITARLALEQGKDVFAVPGHTTAAVSEGCRELIRQGAKPVFSADDILLELAPQLAREAQKALSNRQHTQKTRNTNVADEPPSLLLSEHEIPWIADEYTAKAPAKELRGAKTRTAGTASSTQAKAKPVCKRANLTAEEQAIVALLTDTPQHIDVLSRGLAVPVAGLSANLLVLEMKQAVVRHEGMLYSAVTYE